MLIQPELFEEAGIELVAFSFPNFDAELEASRTRFEARSTYRCRFTERMTTW